MLINACSHTVIHSNSHAHMHRDLRGGSHCPDEDVEDGGREGLLKSEKRRTRIARELDKVEEMAYSFLNIA